MKNKMVFIISAIGAVGGIAAAILSGITEPALPPAYNPAASPYPSAIYAEGIIESAQTSGENINIFPEVAGTVKEILVSEGQQVKAGQPLLRIDDSIQRATSEQQGASADAAATLLRELKAEPRKENLDVADAQVVSAEATLKTAQDTLQKDQAAYEIDPRSVSKDALDSAINVAAVAKANLIVAKKQDDLTKAGAWIYDIQNQDRQQHALERAYAASRALLGKYTLRASRDGIVLAINTIVGNYVSPQGSYDAYTQGVDPVITLGGLPSSLHVRCSVDEILVPRLHLGPKMIAQMSVRGSDVKIPLEFVRVQPYVSPKIELSDERLERVDVRVLPVIFKITKPSNANLYPGELVDVYISE
ncbi:MAG: HlyD family secretion protein [Terriglobia bacterium]